MPLITGPQAQAVAAALAKAGAKWTPFFRQAADENGVAIGYPIRIGCALGMTYRKGRQSNFLSIDVPGVIVGQDVMRFEGVVLGSVPPRPGDLICIDGETGEKAKIAHVSSEAAPLIVLALEE